MKPDQERVRNLLTDTVTLLCRNGLSFRDELKVEGLIGITLDNNEVFLVHLNEKVSSGDGGTGENSELAKPSSVPPSPTPSTGKKSRSGSTAVDTVTPRQRSEKRSSSVAFPADGEPGSSVDAPLLVDIKSEMKEEAVSACEVKDQRVPPLHGLPDRDNGMSTPPVKVKRQSTNDNSSSDSSGGTYITGMVRNLHDQMNLGATGAWALPPDLSQIGDANLSLEQFPGNSGNSGWPPTSSGMAVPGTSVMSPDQMAVFLEQYGTGNRRSSADPNKPFMCEYPGCGLTFFHRQNLWRHKKNAGHRATPSQRFKNYVNTYGDSLGGYPQIHANSGVMVEQQEAGRKYEEQDDSLTGNSAGQMPPDVPLTGNSAGQTPPNVSLTGNSAGQMPPDVPKDTDNASRK